MHAAEARVGRCKILACGGGGGSIGRYCDTHMALCYVSTIVIEGEQVA